MIYQDLCFLCNIIIKQKYHEKQIILNRTLNNYLCILSTQDKENRAGKESCNRSYLYNHMKEEQSHGRF